MRWGAVFLLSTLAACKDDSSSGESKKSLPPAYPTVEEASREVAEVACAHEQQCAGDGVDGDLETCVHKRIDPLPDKADVLQCTQDQIKQCTFDLAAQACPDGGLAPQPPSCVTIATCPTFK